MTEEERDRLIRLITCMAEVVDKHVRDVAIRQRIKTDWAAIRL